MSKIASKALEMVQAKGYNLMQSDLDEIRGMFVGAPESDLDAHPWVFERIAFIVNDPRYQGDIPPQD